MPALAPALRDEDDDPLVFMGGTVSAELACWPVADGPGDDKPVDGRLLDSGSLVCVSAMK